MLSTHLIGCRHPIKQVAPPNLRCDHHQHCNLCAKPAFTSTSTS